MGLCNQGNTKVNLTPGILPFLGTVEAQPYYWPKLERFFRRWGSLWPILSPKEFYSGVSEVLEMRNIHITNMIDKHVGYLMQLCHVLAINAWDDPGTANDHQTDNSMYYFSIAAQVSAAVRMRGDMLALQSLLLASLYHQLTGNHSSLAYVTGASVRLAQSLGLHRHHRRFKFCASEVELRNRVWWAVHNIDV